MAIKNCNTPIWIWFWGILTLMFAWLTEKTMNQWIFAATMLSAIILIIATTKTIRAGTISCIYRHNPFELEFQLNRTFRGKRPILYKQKIPMGTSRLLIRMRPKQATTFDRMHIRLVNTKNANSDFPEREDVGITTTAIEAESFLDHKQLSENDKTNGKAIALSQPYRCAPEDSIYLEVSLTSRIEWNGYILIEAIRADGHRGQGYLELEIYRLKDKEK